MHDALAITLPADAAAFAALDYRDSKPGLLAKLAHAHPPDGLEALAAMHVPGGAQVVGLACGSDFRESFSPGEQKPLQVERVALADLQAVLG